ncbi:D-alanyl-D-alanine carboxypeptidase family protein [Tabrizicola sp.]|jgi:D-alanyl-D-alanine carboxypeptidase (penicillin-binding protein 5/6)|uniref:D-alanyl-D-alanine carboxypeptidase family protein n=1 Tax=Tabrizicola sp. TaxID=2005166 RepID=UPI001A3BE1FF|nr:D-alanyl-D-alanine carboxypeptidase family protein [Tabrizicola sp.]MBL9062758.1 D-alanyl-D-alanine carboxypeptidase [Tabrizicola sp.]
MSNRLRLVLTLLAFVLAALPARAFETAATAAWVYDMTTGTVLMDKNADQPVPPASMSKLMTINMLFEALKDGRVTMDTTFAVSDRAVQMTRDGGSTMMLQHDDRPTVEELIHGMIINSGNDACVVVAEGLAGTEEAFAQQMTQRGPAIGLTNSTFVNASGWPAEGHRMSMRDLGILGKRLIEEFPEYYPIFGMTEYSYKDRSPDNRFNRNPLLDLGIGADGLKTGHTSEAGYGLVGSAKQGDRRIIFAITGLPSDKARAEEAERIVGWAFRQFSEKTVAKSGIRVAEAEVHLGDADTVGLVPAEDVKLLVPALVQDNLTAEVVYNGPLIAPVIKGSAVAELIVHAPDLPDRRVPLVAEADVGKAGFLKRVTTAGKVLYDQYLGAPAS